MEKSDRSESESLPGFGMQLKRRGSTLAFNAYENGYSPCRSLSKQGISKCVLLCFLDPRVLLAQFFDQL